MLEKNGIYEAVVTDYTAEGQGIAHVDGCAVFLPNAIAGERVRLRIEYPRKTWASGKILEILEKSPHRVNRECPVAKLCGGCDFWHMDYEEETRLKAERVRTCLNRLAGENLTQVPILAAPDCRGYRNKAQYPVAAKKGRAFAGFYRSGTHQVVENKSCRILPPETDAVKDAVIDYVNQCRVSVYDETTGKGLVRHVCVRVNRRGESLCCVVVNGNKVPREPELAGCVTAAVPHTVGVLLNSNTRRGNVILGDKYRTLYGQNYLMDTLCGLEFKLSMPSFYQVNRDQAEVLYHKALEFAGLTGRETVLDLYCGIGTITLCLAKAAKRVIGAEIVPPAIRDAKENAVRNGIENAEFFCGDAADIAARLEEEGLRPDVVTVDPPRKGLAPEVIASVAAMGPEKVVYVSCDPATLGRDVKIFGQLGYQAVRAAAVDMFPGTAHVETVVLLSREDN